MTAPRIPRIRHRVQMPTVTPTTRTRWYETTGLRIAVVLAIGLAGGVAVHQLLTLLSGAAS